MERLISVLEKCCPNVDFKSEEKIVTNKVIDSLDLVTIIEALENEYDVEIPFDMIEPENFDSAGSILELVEKVLNSK